MAEAGTLNKINPYSKNKKYATYTLEKNPMNRKSDT
jgi:hypothetical protein